MKLETFALAVAFGLSATSVSASTLITFDGTPDNYEVLQSYDGFDFDFSASGWGVVATDFACCAGQNVLNGSNKLLLSGQRNDSFGAVTISKAGGGTFSIASFDSATAFLGTDGQLLVTGFVDGGGTVSTLVDLNPFYESHVLVGYTNLVSVVFAENTLAEFDEYGVGLDNLVLDANAVIPEPATWAMFIAGFGLMGAAVRRRRALMA